MAEPVSASIHIDAPAEKVWSMVTDLPRMGEWSPEATGGSWRGSGGASVGATFRGSNQNGKRKWKTTTKVIACDAPTHFAFDTMIGPIAAAHWSYRITPAGDGCEVTEQWDGPPDVLRKLSGLATGRKDRTAFTKTSIETTLANLKAAAEG